MRSAVECVNPLLGLLLVSSALLFGWNARLAAAQVWEDLFDDHLANARAGAADAQYEVGIMYLKGQGVGQDRQKALEWLKKSSEGGYQLATSKLSRIDEQESKFRQLQSEAEKGSLDAQYEVGMMYLKGRGIEADDSKGRDWLQRAADKGDSRAITRLGILNYKGESGSTNYKKALSLFERVSDKSVLAQYYLGEMYATGSGVAKNYNRAISWYTKAADGGFNRARGRIINLREEMALASRHHANDAHVANARPEVLARRDNLKAKPVSDAPVTQFPQTRSAPQPVSPFDKLARKQWLRGERPVDYLPSRVTQCDQYHDTLVCFSEVLTRITGTQTVEYRVKSVISTDKDRFTVTYRNLVLDVTDSEEPEDQPLGYDNLTEQGFRIHTGWTPEHVVSCEQPAHDSMRCIKDRTYRMTLVAVDARLASGGTE